MASRWKQAAEAAIASRFPLGVPSNLLTPIGNNECANSSVVVSSASGSTPEKAALFRPESANGSPTKPNGTIGPNGPKIENQKSEHSGEYFAPNEVVFPVSPIRANSAISADSFADPITSDLPEHVVTGLHLLRASAPLWDESLERWGEIVETARRLACQWYTQARRMGWRDLDLFGLHPAAPRARYEARGLFFTVVTADRITALTDRAAAIQKASGSIVRFYRPGHDNGAVLAWELCRGAR